MLFVTNFLLRIVFELSFRYCRWDGRFVLLWVENPLDSLHCWPLKIVLEQILLLFRFTLQVLLGIGVNRNLHIVVDRVVVEQPHFVLTFDLSLYVWVFQQWMVVVKYINVGDVLLQFLLLWFQVVKLSCWLRGQHNLWHF